MKSIGYCSVGDCVLDIYELEGIATLGGTAFYSALAASDTGVKTSIISAVGNDYAGTTYADILRSHNINIRKLRFNEKQTSQISIRLDKDGKPEFSQWRLGALSELHLTDSDQSFIKKYDIARVVLFKSFEYIFTQVYKMALSQTLKIADFSGGSAYSNEKEIIEKYVKGFDIIAKSVTEQEFSSLEYYQQLAVKTEKIILLTAGRLGSVVFDNNKRYFTPVRKVIEGNTTGSGDVYLATFAINYTNTGDIRHSMTTATESVFQFLKENKYRYRIAI